MVPGTIRTGGALAVMHDQRPVKQAMRARIRDERRHRDVVQREADARALAALVLELPEISRARCVAAYASMPGEPETGALRQALRESGVRVLLPVVLADGHLDWAVDTVDLRPAVGVGGPEPTGPRLGLEGIGQADVVIVPALAVDSLGNRLGQGAGYYDRTLRLIDATVPVLALVHESEVLDAAIEPIPVEPHDLPVDAVVTPHRCLRLPPRRRG
jgi:5-formyltetrahydrofolate cyclo-ligase